METPGSAPKAKAKRKKNSAGSPVEEQRNEFLKGTRKGRRVLDVQKKLDVIEMLDKGKTQREVAAQLGVSKTQVLNISRCRAALYKRQLTSKVAKFGKFADIDKAVFDWFCRVRTPVGLRKPLPVSLAALQARARHEARLRNVHNFKASDGLLTGIDKYDELHLMASHIVAGCRGLEYCLPPNLLDTAIIWKKAWDELDQSVIVSCWVHSHCLPVTDEAIVASEHRDYRKATTDSIVTKMCDELKSLDLQSDSTVGTLQSIGILDAVSAVGKGDTSLMEKWIDVEDDQEVAASIELQVLDKICSDLDEAAVEQPDDGGGGGDDDDDDDEGDNGLEKPPVTKEFSEKMLMAARQAHCIAGELNDPQLLSIAKQLWLSAHSKLIIAGKV
ncbi:hypothetical protein EMCRGX_G013222 [Ephydatia muelleri]